MKYFFAMLLVMSLVRGSSQPQEGLVRKSLPRQWDEGFPLGNGWLGALVWQRDNKLRLSLDRVDLWDDRPMPIIDQLTFNWVRQQVAKGDYAPVQRLGDDPYEQYAAPSKIPGAAIEFDMKSLGKVTEARLDIRTATATIRFNSGVRFTTIVHATTNTGLFYIDGVKNTGIVPKLIAPAYVAKKNTVLSPASLDRLGYAQGTLSKSPGEIVYHQPTYGTHYYEVLVQWKKNGRNIEGSWTITNGMPAKAVPGTKEDLYETHLSWWKDYWDRSTVTIPDTLLQHQYNMEMYKFGCVARDSTPPISLQAIWTADNGSLPPWKGDLHHDLNTELSYWPGYAANHLDLTGNFTAWLWKVKKENESWTSRYFGVGGINVPGVTTITGKPMGGWIQYSMSPTTSSWLAQHFYLQWQYSMDDRFLKERCYPYLAGVAEYLDKIMIQDPQTGLWMMPLSSSPEYNDNSLRAWFTKNTNYDLALIHNLYQRYAEVAAALRLPSESIALKRRQISGLNVNETGLTIAPGFNVQESHRHLSQLMAVYPLGLLNKDNEPDKITIENSLKTLEKQGTRYWVGYSFAWNAILYAQLGLGSNAVKNLRIFAGYFCSGNSFHVNGDQRGGRYSNFTYRPFTLDGNFAFAEGVHQLLLRSNHGYIDLFPAIPADWRNVSFHTLRTQGAFLVSATRKNGITEEVRILSEKGGRCRIKAPFKTFIESGIERNEIYQGNNDILEFNTVAGQTITLKNGFE